MKYIAIDKVLKSLMKKRNISLRELSLKTSIPYPTLHAWSIGRPPKDIVKLKVICDFFKISFEDLLFDEKFYENDKRSTSLPAKKIKAILEITVIKIN